MLTEAAFLQSCLKTDQGLMLLPVPVCTAASARRVKEPSIRVKASQHSMGECHIQNHHHIPKEKSEFRVFLKDFPRVGQTAKRAPNFNGMTMPQRQK